VAPAADPKQCSNRLDHQRVLQSARRRTYFPEKCRGIGTLAQLFNVRFGSQAVVQDNTSSMSAFGGKAVVHRPDFTSPRLNVRFHRYRTFDQANYCNIEGPLSAISGPSPTQKETRRSGFLMLVCRARLRHLRLIQPSSPRAEPNSHVASPPTGCHV